MYQGAGIRAVWYDITEYHACEQKQKQKKSTRSEQNGKPISSLSVSPNSMMR